MLPKSIATSVAPETITRVTRLFNGSATDILNELLQNARRAGATRVTVSTSGTADDRVLHIVDDGSGIDDPKTIVTLGRSGWSAATRESEDPAGMGVFSLAGREVVIRSWSRSEHQGWCAHIPANAWESSSPIAITTHPIQCGTAISVRMPADWPQNLEQILAAVVRYYPLPVSFEGQDVPRKEWLADAIRVEGWNGSLIGIFRDTPELTSIHDPRVNFHGLTIPCPLPRISEVDHGARWTARVDIIDTPAIQLVLPARKEAVQNGALDELRTAVKCAIYRAIAEQPTHRLGYHEWVEARDLGINLPPADLWRIDKFI